MILAQLYRGLLERHFVWLLKIIARCSKRFFARIRRKQHYGIVTESYVDPNLHSSSLPSRVVYYTIILATSTGCVPGT